LSLVWSQTPYLRAAEATVATAEAMAGYGCSTASGAILALKNKYGTDHDLDLPDAADLEKYACGNVPEILERLKGREYKDIVVITGVTMTGDWDAAVWTSGSKAGTLSLGAGPMIVMAKTLVSLSKSQDQSVLRSDGHHHNPEAEIAHPNCTGDESECRGVENQCIFIRGFRLRKKHMFSSKYKASNMKAAAGPDDPDVAEGDDNQEAPAVAAQDSVPAESQDSVVTAEPFPEKEVNDALSVIR
jgi:hypothetical protein